MGLTDIDYSTTLHAYVLNGNFWSYSIQLLTQLIFMASLLDALARRYLYLQSETGNDFHHIYVIAMPISQLFAYIWLRTHQESHRMLLQMLTQLARRLKVDTLQLTPPRWLCRFWMVFCALYSCDLALGYSFCNAKGAQCILLHLSFYVHLVRINYITVYYTSLVYLMMVLLQSQAYQLRGETHMNLEKLTRNLGIHDELLLLCHEKIVLVFGGAFVFISLYSFLEAICICYLATVEDYSSVLELLYVFSWMIPIFCYLCMPLVVNNLARQVSTNG